MAASLLRTRSGRSTSRATRPATSTASRVGRSAHAIRFSIDLKAGAAGDQVKIFVDGKSRITGTTWKNYYLFDSEQAGNGNAVPSVDKLLIRESSSANPGQGFLIDQLSLSSAAKQP